MYIEILLFDFRMDLSIQNPMRLAMPVIILVGMKYLFDITMKAMDYIYAIEVRSIPCGEALVARDSNREHNDNHSEHNDTRSHHDNIDHFTLGSTQDNVVPDRVDMMTRSCIITAHQAASASSPPPRANSWIDQN